MFRLIALILLFVIGNVVQAGDFQRELDAVVVPLASKARIGVAITKGDSVVAQYNGDELFPMSSVFKFPLALAVLDSLDRSGEGIEQLVSVRKEELEVDTWSPMRDVMTQEVNFIPLADLIGYALVQSDNNAADILLYRFGGSSFVMDYLNSIDADTAAIRIIYNEAQMHSNPERAKDNCASPAESARLCGKLVANDIISEADRKWLMAQMINCSTGKARLPKYLEDSFTIGHKTGTGFVDEYGRITGVNDVAFVITPDNESFAIAVYVTDAAMTMPEVEELIAQVGRCFREHFFQ